MNNEQLSNYKVWFDRFVAGFYGDDEYVNANIRLKENHSKRVCEEILYLADELKLSQNQRLLAQTVALFHDIGRFPQFVRYRTYHDPRSTNHCLLALDVLREEKIIDDMQADEKQIVETAVKHHGDKELPENLTGDTLLLSRLIRDADKIDIYYVMALNYRRYKEDPDSFGLEVELPDEPNYSPAIIEAILNEQNIDYASLRTLNDMKLINLAWVYDMNFVPTLKRVKHRGYLEAILDVLPDTEDIRKVRSKVLGYVDSRIVNT